MVAVPQIVLNNARHIYLQRNYSVRNGISIDFCLFFTTVFYRYPLLQYKYIKYVSGVFTINLHQFLQPYGISTRKYFSLTLNSLFIEF